jgi:methylglutaconyl-CoA hydratase
MATIDPSAATGPVLIERRGSTAILTLNRPAAMNALSVELVAALDQSLRDLRGPGTGGGIRALIITGAGSKAFCAGADLKERRAMSLGDTRRFLTALNSVVDAVAAFPAAVIAAVNGVAFGGGFELALACDLRFAAEGGYQIGLPEVNLGLFPGSGGTQRLPRLVGLSKGIDLIANATTMNPAQAKELGLVDRLFADAAACRDGAIDYATKLAAGPSVAIGHAKLAITQGYGAPLDLGLAIEREAISRVFVSADADEGIKAFGEKRKAEFKGD